MSTPLALASPSPFVGARTGGGDLTLNLRVDDDGEELSVAFRDGAVETWEARQRQDADVSLCVSRRAAEKLVFGDAMPIDLSDEIAISVRGLTTRLPPFDLQPEDLSAGVLFGADARIAYRCPLSPFGEVVYTEEFVSGCLNRYTSDILEHQVRIEVPYAATLDYRVNEIEVLEALSFARVEGAPAYLELALALVERDEYRRAISAHSELVKRVQTLTHHCSSSAWRSAQRAARGLRASVEERAAVGGSATYR